MRPAALGSHGAPDSIDVCSRERWKDLGSFVLDIEIDREASIFTRSSTGRGYRVTCVYDLAQTEGGSFTGPSWRTAAQRWRRLSPPC